MNHSVSGWTEERHERTFRALESRLRSRRVRRVRMKLAGGVALTLSAISLLVRLSSAAPVSADSATSATSCERVAAIEADAGMRVD